MANFDPDQDVLNLTTIYNLVMRGCKGEINKETVVSSLQSQATSNFLAATLVSDILETINQELDEVFPNDPVPREIFTFIVKSCGNLMSYVFQERLETDTLFEAGVCTGSSQAYNRKFVRTKTKLFFKQQKYNLLREECEGYSKLLSELCDIGSVDNNPQHSIQVIQCLIGRFNLDPNRAIDVILQAFQCQPNCNFFVSLLQKLNAPSNTVCELLGSKLIDTENCTQTLFTLIAHLLQHHIISLDEIYPWLTPDDRTIQRQWARELNEAKEYARKSMIVTINKDATKEQEEISPAEDLFFDNQKFCLCEALISVGAWDDANNLMKRLPEYCCMSNRRIAYRHIEYLDYLLRPMIKRITPNYISKNQPAGFLSKTNSKIPKQIKKFEDFEKSCHLIIALGPYIHFSPEFMYKLLRVMRSFFESGTSDRLKGKNLNECKLYYLQLTILDQVILPALCFLDSNCAISEEIWSVLQLYPYEQRFFLYGSWKGEAIVLLHPSLLRKRVDLVKKVKHLMRRISKENVKLMGRNLGKLSHSMPAVVFDYILSQVQLFDNLIMPVIDALKFLTNLSYDVLGYCLLEALSPSRAKNKEGFSVMLLPNRPRTKHDGSTIAPWLQSLASFTGAICKKYPLELIPLLQYIANQLKSKQSLDLLLLKEIVQKMTGIEAAEEMTSEQLDAMGGGELLRGEAGYFGQIRTAKKSAARLREASSANDLAVTLCILMAQQRDCIIYNESSNLHTKLVGKLYDECQDTLVQFGSFLAVSCTLDDYARKIPPLRNLVEEYHVSSDVAFFLWRPLFAHDIQTKYDELKKAEKVHKTLTTVQRQLKYVEAANFVLDPIAEMMRNHLPMKTWDDISPQFFVTFWSLTLYDLFVPTEAYNREVLRVKGIANAAAENKDLTSSKRKKEQERCNNLIERLHDEKKRQKEHVERVIAKLNKEKDSWFASRTAKSAKNEAVTAFLQLCLFPRCIFTAPDALYCAHFVNIIHSLSTPNFSTLICYDRIFCDIIYAVTSCSENEANRYGRFLCALLGTVMRWHGDKAVFDKECASFPGFITKFRAANTLVTESTDHVEYENYRHVCHKWHYKITKSVIVCLESKDFTQIRNSLIVLKRILPYYPRIMNLANAVERWVERVRSEQKDKRQDLFALATSYIGQLKSRWGSVVAEEDFHLKSAPPKPATENKSKPATEVKSNSSSQDESSSSKPANKTPESKSTPNDDSPASKSTRTTTDPKVTKPPPEKVSKTNDATTAKTLPEVLKTLKIEKISKSNDTLASSTSTRVVTESKAVKNSEKPTKTSTSEAVSTGSLKTTIKSSENHDEYDYSPRSGSGSSESKRARIEKVERNGGVSGSNVTRGDKISYNSSRSNSPSRKSSKRRSHVSSSSRSYK